MTGARERYDMQNYNFWSKLIIAAVSYISSFYIFAKSLRYAAPVKHKTYSVIWCLLGAFAYVARPDWFASVIFRIIFCVTSIVFIWRLTKIKTDTVISAYLFAYAISYCLGNIAALLIGLVFSAFLSGRYEGDSIIDFNEPVYLFMYAVVALFQLLLTCLFFRVRRFKNGFPFLFNKYAIVASLIAIGILLALHTLIVAPRESFVNAYDLLSLLLCIPIVGVGVIIWIRHGITAFYKQKVQERGAQILERELSEKDQEIKRLTEQNNILRAANHKINHRLAAMERSVASLAEIVQNEEISKAAQDIKRLTQDYQSDIDRIKGKNPLPSTKIRMLDEIFGYFAEMCGENNIDFNLKLNGSIPYMTQQLIPLGKLETMIGDHLQDALTAVKASDNKFRGILALLGLAGDFYEFTVYDSGIPFEAETLKLLGTKHITTHAETGGGGIGFMTTFETMRECGASLIISEKNPGELWSKSVTIRFDGKNRYTVESN
jgi:signal transduction histidine kinase